MEQICVMKNMRANGDGENEYILFAQKSKVQLKRIAAPETAKHWVENLGFKPISPMEAWAGGMFDYEETDVFLGEWIDLPF